MKYDVFISYSRKDTAVADRICAVLDRAGISYFIDRQGICGGMEFPDILAEAITECDKILFLASANSYASKFTNNEIVFAYNEKPRNSIIPYRIDDAPMPAALRFMFAGVNWRTIEEHPVDTVLVDDLLGLLGRSRKIDPAAPISNPTSAPAKTYRVGDYYGENGKEGVVFAVDAAGRHGKIVSMKQKELPWCIFKEIGRITGATDKADGARNQRTIERIDGWREKYPAFAWCAELGEGWYLPAIGELEALLLDEAVHDAVNRTLVRHDGDKLFDKGDGKAYMSSTESEENKIHQWSVRMIVCDVRAMIKAGHGFFRAVSVF